MSDFAQGFALGAMMMRERAARVADEEVLFAMGAREHAALPDGETIHAISLQDYWSLRVGVGRMVADEIYHLPITGEKP